MQTAESLEWIADVCNNVDQRVIANEYLQRGGVPLSKECEELWDVLDTNIFQLLD